MLFSTPPLSITDYPADRLHQGGVRLGYRFITLHATAGSLDSSLHWLTTTSPPSNPVSVHRVISKQGHIYKLVSDEAIAWHAGYATVGALPRRNAQGAIIESFNQWSLGIELENDNTGHDPYPPLQVLACVNQVVEWIGMYGFLPIVAHSWVDRRKSDPAGFSWDAFYQTLWSRLKVVARRD